MDINRLMNNYAIINRMKQNNFEINKSMSRLSSGKRVNTASDSPSDILRINRFNSQIRGGQMAQRNIQDGLSFLQVKETAVDEMSSIAQRLKELSTQYKNDTLNDDDKKTIELETSELLKNLQNIKGNTKFNNKNVFENKKVEIQSGANPYDIIDINTGDVNLPDLNSINKVEVIKKVLKELNTGNIDEFIKNNDLSSSTIIQNDKTNITKDVIKELNGNNIDDFIKSNDLYSSQISHKVIENNTKDVTKELNGANINDFISSNNISSSKITHTVSDSVTKDVVKELNKDNVRDFVNSTNLSSAEITHAGTKEVIKDVTRELNQINIDAFVKENNLSSAQITHTVTTTENKTVTKEINASNIDEFFKSNNISSSKIIQNNCGVNVFDFSFSTQLNSMVGYDVNFHFEKNPNSSDEYFVTGNTAFSRVQGIAKFDENNKTLTVDYRYGCVFENADRYTFKNISQLSDLRNCPSFTAFNGQERPVLRVVNYSESKESQNISSNDLANQILNPSKDNSFNIQSPDGKTISITIKDGKASYQTQEKVTTSKEVTMNLNDFVNTVKNPSKNDVINIKYPNGQNQTITIKDGKATYQTKEKELVPDTKTMSTNDLINEISNPTNNDTINIKYPNGQNQTITIKDGKATYVTQEKQLVQKEVEMNTNDLINAIKKPSKNDIINIKKPNGDNLSITIKDGKAYYQDKETISSEKDINMSVSDLINAIKKPSKNDIINIKKSNGESLSVTIKDGKAYYQDKETISIDSSKNISVNDFINTIKNPTTNGSITIKNADGKNTVINIKDGKAYYEAEEKEFVDKQFDVKDVLSGDYIENNLIKSLSMCKTRIGVKTNELERKYNLEQAQETNNVNALSKIEDVDMAKEMMNKVKNQMLLNISNQLFSENLEDNRAYIIKLLT